jgi:hypothetical protein
MQSASFRYLSRIFGRVRKIMNPAGNVFKVSVLPSA